MFKLSMVKKWKTKITETGNNKGAYEELRLSAYSLWFFYNKKNTIKSSINTQDQEKLKSKLNKRNAKVSYSYPW